jgi:hypothetical protein
VLLEGVNRWAEATEGGQAPSPTCPDGAVNVAPIVVETGTGGGGTRLADPTAHGGSAPHMARRTSPSQQRGSSLGAPAEPVAGSMASRSVATESTVVTVPPWGDAPAAGMAMAGDGQQPWSGELRIHSRVSISEPLSQRRG